MSANGDIMVGEMRLRTLMSASADTLAAGGHRVGDGVGWRHSSRTAMAATPVK